MLLHYCLVNSLTGVAACLVKATQHFMLVLGTLLGMSVATALLSEIIQTGFICKPSLVLPKAERLNPLKGLMRMLSGFGEIPLRLVGVMCLTAVAVTHGTVFLSQVMADLGGQANTYQVGAGMTRYMMVLLAAFWIIAAVDYVIQRRRYMRQLSMSFQEMREEQKELDGDPAWKHYRRVVQEETALRALVDRVRRSQVIIVEPVRTE